MFLIGMQWTFHCFLVQIDSVGVFVWALAPFCFGVFLLFVSLFPLAKRKSGWGICGSSLLVWLLFLCFASIDLLISRTVRPCTDVFAAYSHVRTEPLARHRPNSRKKSSWQDFLANKFLHRPASRISHLLGHRMISQRRSRTVSNVDGSPSAHR